MIIHLLSIGHRPPTWCNEGFQSYAKRLPPHCALHLIEIPAPVRSKKGDESQAIAKEGKLMLKAIPKNSEVWALDRKGQSWSTEQLAEQLALWLAKGNDLALLIGGADGLETSCLAQAKGSWSLSALTFPHHLTRIIVAEQLYRAFSLLNHHPYHRGDERA